MPEKRKASVTNAFLRFTTIASAVAIMLMGALWIGDDLFHFQKDSERIRQEFLEARQNELRQEVKTYLAKIADQRATLDDTLRADLRRRVEEAWSVADSLFRLNMGKKSTAELAEMIREALRPIRYNNRRGYFFATSLDGTEQLFADRPELEGQNLLDMKDTSGKFVIRDMIRIAREQGEGFYEYTWTKPHTPGVNHPKLAYIKYLAHLDWFIGTGEYIADVEADRQNEILRQLEFERFGTGGYFFAGTLDGISLAGPAKGSNVFDVTDVNGVKIVQEMIKAAQNGGGFVEYVLPPFSATNPHRKLSYVTMVPGWNWYLGAVGGQGMISHIGMTTAARYFAAQRGRAVALAAMGFPLAEALLPTGAALLLLWVGWRVPWVVGAGLLCLLILPVLFLLSRGAPPPHEIASKIQPGANPGTDRSRFSRRDVLGDPGYYLILPATLLTPFTVTALFFHQMAFADELGWSLELLAAGFSVYAACHLGALFIAGPLVDRLGAARALPLALIPIVTGLVLLASVPSPLIVYAYLGMVGATQGLSATASGAIWAERYGILHLGAIRSMNQAVMVVSTAVSPILLGFFLDRGVTVAVLALALAAIAVVAALMARLGAWLEGRYPARDRS